MVRRLFQDDPELAAKRAAIREGIASADAGRLVPHEEVRRWLLSWGTGKRLPKPECKQAGSR
ncbi:CopG family transcriptional regulator [Inquilinus limosus]|uniref:CopG family transcriptional regulator n=1 Tax=Inquilinus limosus TaxID=171674 RepID=A0A211ZFC3_9PROT|nr:CopG family transcriptional regulator [Inquilinus limosus]